MYLSGPAWSAPPPVEDRRPGTASFSAAGRIGCDAHVASDRSSLEGAALTAAGAREAAAALAAGAAAAYLAGAIVAARAGVAPAPAAAGIERRAAAPAAPAPLAVLLERNPFGLAVGGEAAPAAEATPAPPRGGRLKLLGVAVAGPRSRALIRDLDAGRTDLYGLGEMIGTERLAAVRADRVVLAAAGGGRREIELGVEPGAAPPPARAAAAPAVGPGGARTYSRSELLAAIGGRDRVDAILGQSRLLPRFVDGRIQGFRIEDIAAESLIGEMGIEAGDVILRVNGQNLDSHERAFQIWQEAKTAGEVVLEIDRGGRPETLRYRIAP